MAGSESSFGTDDALAASVNEYCAIQYILIGHCLKDFSYERERAASFRGRLILNDVYALGKA